MRRTDITKSIISLCLAVIVLTASFQTVPASESIGEIIVESPGESSESNGDESSPEQVVPETGESAVEEFDITNNEFEEPALEPSPIIEAAAEGTASDDSRLAGENAQGTEVAEPTVEEPTVEESEKADYYTDGIPSWVDAGNVPRSPFPDVQDMKQDYYEYICWAGNNKVSNGFSDGTFRSTNSCTRGEAMMFIWKMMGKPALSNADGSRFKDVPVTHPYYKAILWAEKRGVTNGYHDGTFGINKVCTRGHVMRFLWNLKGRPAPSYTEQSPFKDIASPHPYYKAVLWGSQKKITNGFSDGTFGTDMSCTRGQIVTFLYKYYMLDFYTCLKSHGEIVSMHSPLYTKNGQRYEKIMDADKKLISVPTVPKKVLFIGNSLLQGLGSTATGGRFGMCASDKEHDYATLVERAILKKNGNAVFAKLSGTAFEGCTDTETARKWYGSKRSMFSEDLDLIIIQLGDNVNTPEKTTAFRKNICPFLRQLKADCPKARVIFVAAWYKRPAVINAIIDACKKEACDYVGIGDLHTPDTVPHEGYVITYNDGTAAVAAGGSLSHPNNKGMEMIAQRILSLPLL